MSKSRGLHVRYAAVALLMLSMALAGGCGRSKLAEQVRNLRLSGQADSARTEALALLTANSSQMDLWLEFARSTLEAVRLRPNEERRDGDLDLLVQASLVCAGDYRLRKQQPSREWRDTGKVIAAELARQVSTISITMSSQMQQATILKQILVPDGADSVVPRGPDIRAQATLANYRMEARKLLFWPVVMRRLLESLPESNPGTAALLAGQLDEAQSAWVQALELDPAYITTVQQRARQLVDQALDHAEQDLRDLGYFLPQTIIENGVSQ